MKFAIKIMCSAIALAVAAACLFTACNGGDTPDKSDKNTESEFVTTENGEIFDNTDNTDETETTSDEISDKDSGEAASGNSESESENNSGKDDESQSEKGSWTIVVPPMG